MSNSAGQTLVKLHLQEAAGPSTLFRQGLGAWVVRIS
jgi:hypothetical protein